MVIECVSPIKIKFLPEPATWRDSLSSHQRIPPPLEAHHAGLGYRTADRGLLPPARPGLGYSNQFHHGRSGLSDCALELACAGHAAMAAFTSGAVLDVAHSGWLLLAVLAQPKSAGAGLDARRQLARVAGAVRGVRAVLVLPRQLAPALGRLPKLAGLSQPVCRCP